MWPGHCAPEPTRRVKQTPPHGSHGLFPGGADAGGPPGAGAGSPPVLASPGGHGFNPRPLSLRLLQVLGPRRTLQRAQKNFRTGNNYTEVRFSDVSPTEMDDVDARGFTPRASWKPK